MCRRAWSEPPSSLICICNRVWLHLSVVTENCPGLSTVSVSLPPEEKLKPVQWLRNPFKTGGTPSCFSNTPGTLLPQGLCTGCSSTCNSFLQIPRLTLSTTANLSSNGLHRPLRLKCQLPPSLQSPHPAFFSTSHSNMLCYFCLLP